MNLKKLLLICLLSLSLPAFAQQGEGLSADWVLISSGDDDSFAYANFKSLERNGNIVKSWTALVSLKNKISGKVLIEVNCKTNQERELSMIVYNDTKFSEIGLRDNKPSPWIHILPGSIGQERKDKLCAYKP
jgi:hypothetical protein